MTNTELIRQEIAERKEYWTARIEFAPRGQAKDTCESRVTELSDLLSFIDSLPEETVTDCNELEKRKIKIR